MNSDCRIENRGLNIRLKTRANREFYLRYDRQGEGSRVSMVISELFDSLVRMIQHVANSIFAGWCAYYS